MNNEDNYIIFALRSKSYINTKTKEIIIEEMYEQSSLIYHNIDDARKNKAFKNSLKKELDAIEYRIFKLIE